MTVIEHASLPLVRRALAEDLAGYGDITSEWTVPPDLTGRAVITAREELVVCGLPLAEAVMSEVDPRAIFTSLVEDGAEATDRDQLATIEGPARSILTAERTMLNFLSHLSGVATQSRRFARAVEGTGATVVDTRKTTPGLRAWEKRAVVCGGCRNHRFGLFDMVLVKNNHLAAAGGVRQALDRVEERTLALRQGRGRGGERSRSARGHRLRGRRDHAGQPGPGFSGKVGPGRPGTRAPGGARGFRRCLVEHGSGGSRDRGGPHLHQRSHHGGALGGSGADSHYRRADRRLKAAQRREWRCCWLST